MSNHPYIAGADIPDYILGRVTPASGNTTPAAEQINTVRSNLEASGSSLVDPVPFHVRDMRRKLDLACAALRHYAKIDNTLGVDSVAGKALTEIDGIRSITPALKGGACG